MMDQARIHWRSFSQAPDPKQIDVLFGVRALLVFLVGWYHIWQQAWLSSLRLFGAEISVYPLVTTGYLWVDGLILLSGFLLYLPYAEAGSRLPRIGAFYKRRLIRILPSYLLCVIPMFVLACVQGRYSSGLDAAKDLAAHLTFTHNLFPFSYFSSPINGALWTLAVEMQFYLLFPFLAWAYKRWPLVTWLLLAAAAFGFRYWAGLQPDSSLYVNQLPAFLDVYANGFLAATAFAAIRKRIAEGMPRSVKLFFTVGAGLCLWALIQLVNAQHDWVAGPAAQVWGYFEAIRRGQMDRRFMLSAALGGFMVCASFSLYPARFLLGNWVMRFLASVSFQFYIYHQMLAVKLREWHFPPAEPWIDENPALGLAENSPRTRWDAAWQLKYTLLCFLLALALAALITYLFERPLARLLRRRTHAEEKKAG